MSVPYLREQINQRSFFYNGKSRLRGGFLVRPSPWRLASSGLTKAYEFKDINKMPDGQEEFQYDEKVLSTCETYISSERLAAYLNHARGDKWVAIRLYERNTEISEALYGVIQGLEVTLRNAIHNVLAKKLERADWYEAFSLQDSERKSIDEAKANVIGRQATETPGRVVAELKFGFWVKLFAHPYDKSLWVPYLRLIFPLRLQNSRAYIHGRLVELKTLRNRIAHHERITCGKRDSEKDYTAVMETIGWVNPLIHDWIESTNCFKERFDKRLPKKPKPTNRAILE
jgi:hypothetical protein